MAMLPFILTGFRFAGIALLVLALWLVSALLFKRAPRSARDEGQDEPPDARISGAGDDSWQSGTTRVYGPHEDR